MSPVRDKRCDSCGGTIRDQRRTRHPDCPPPVADKCRQRSVSLRDAHWERLGELARASGLSRSGLIQRWIDDSR